MIIFDNQHYQATFHKGLLCVTNKHSRPGKSRYGSYLKGEQAEHWATEIKTAIDKQKGHALCNAIYNSN